MGQKSFSVSSDAGDDAASRSHTTQKQSSRSSTVAFLLLCVVLAVFSLAHNHDATSPQDVANIAAPASSPGSAVRDNVFAQDDKGLVSKALIQTKGLDKHAKKDKKQHKEKKHQFNSDELAKMNADKRQVVSERQAIDKEEGLVKSTKKAIEDERKHLKKIEKDVKDERKLLSKGSFRKARKLADADQKLDVDLEIAAKAITLQLAEEQAADSEEALIAGNWKALEDSGVSKEMKAKHAKEEHRHAKVADQKAKLEKNFKDIEKKRKDLSEFMANERKSLASA